MAIRGKIFVLAALILTLAVVSPVFAGEKQKLSDAWWTGPLQTPNAGTIPKNHIYIETYFAVEQDNGSYGNNSTKYGANTKNGCAIGIQCGYQNDFQSTTLFKYGITNKFNLDFLLGFDGAQGGAKTAGSNGASLNTLRIRLPYKLNSYKQGKVWPTFSIVPEVNTPVAANSAWTPGIGFWAIRPFWMPGGRILRVRASEDLWFPKGGKQIGTASVDYPKQFQTQVGFEYSLTKKWVPAFDLVYKAYTRKQINGVDATGVTGFSSTGVPIINTLDGRRDWRIDPALEYNFTENTGVIFGVELTVAGRNTGSYIAPQIALQWFK